MNFSNLNKIFENKLKVHLNESLEQPKKVSKFKKRLTESHPLNERRWQLTVPGSYRKAIFDAGEEEDFEGVLEALINICNFVIDHTSEFDEDTAEDIREEYEDLLEELSYIDIEDEDEANYWLDELYDLMDNTDVFLGIDESLNEEYAYRDMDSLYGLDKEIEDYLNQNNFHGFIDLYDINPNDEPVPSITYHIDGDWKHEHLRFKYLVKEFLNSKGIVHMITDREYPSDSDSYEADYTIHLMKHEDDIDESLNEELSDEEIITPLIDAIDAFEDAHKEDFYITWSFGRNKDNKMTAGVDIRFNKELSGDEESYKQELLDIIERNGFTLDASIEYDKQPWKGLMFSKNGYHTQIIEVDGLNESFGYKPSFDEWYLQETGVNTSDLTDEQYDELWNDEDLMNHYRKFCDDLDESLNESNEDKPTKEQFIAYCIIQHSGITNMFNVDKVIEAADYVLDIPLTEENIMYIYEHYSELLDEYHGFNPRMFQSEIYDVKDAYGMDTDDDIDESLNKYEQDLESGYYPDEWDIDFEDELEDMGIEPQRGVYIGYQYRVPNRRFASKMVRLAKEFGYDDSWVEGNILYLKWGRPEKEYHKSPFDESLKEDTVGFTRGNIIKVMRNKLGYEPDVASKVHSKLGDYTLTFDKKNNFSNVYPIKKSGEEFDEIVNALKVFGKNLLPSSAKTCITIDGNEPLTEDTIKQNGKWVNKGKEGTHGTFKTKKQADAQRKAIFANGYKG